MATIVDVARRAGVSIATVSRVISRPDVVAPHTRRRVTIPSVHIDNHAAGFDAMEHLCRLGHHRMAVVTGPDGSGLRGDRLRGALSVVGVDDIAFARSSFPALTTIAQPAREMGQEVVRLLLAFIRGEPVTPVSVILRHQLTVRDSTGPAAVA